MIEGFFAESIVKRAQEKKLVEVEIVDIRKFAIDDYGTVDDKPYGGGVGMVMRVDVVEKAIAKVKSPSSKVIFTSPKGNKFDQQKAKEYSQLSHLVILVGHYEGVDERVIDYIDEEISLGDFVMTGGEIAASAIVDSVVRLIPGVLKQVEATELESFMTISIDRLIGVIGEDTSLQELKKKGVEEVKLLEFPQYTRPENFAKKKVPEVLLSGNHKEIEIWRIKKAFVETLQKRPDLLMIK